MSVLDASALLAYLFREPGDEAIAKIIDTACISSVNFSEVAIRLARDKLGPAKFAGDINQINLDVIPFTSEDALVAASLEPETRPLGLSLGDRACLALGLARRETVYTADRIWMQLNLGLDIVSIR